MENANLQHDGDIDQDLLIKEACRDRAAFAQLYRLHYDNVFRYCARRLFNRHAAEDVTSIVFFKAMRTMGSFEGNSKDFRNWLPIEEAQQLVDGLKYFAEINDGKYPATLSVRGVVIEIGGIYQAKSGDPSFGIDDAKVSTLKYGAQFYETLQADGKAAVYNGPAVTAADADRVLLRWKLDDNQYRVIFGDLRTEDIDAARLQELEKK